MWHYGRLQAGDCTVSEVGRDGKGGHSRRDSASGRRVRGGRTYKTLDGGGERVLEYS